MIGNLIIGRSIALFLACLMWGAFGFYYKALKSYNVDSLRRVLFGLVCIGAAIGLFFLQLNTYISITGISNPVDGDRFFFWLGVLEWTIPGGMLYFMLLIKKLKKTD